MKIHEGAIQSTVPSKAPRAFSWICKLLAGSRQQVEELKSEAAFPDLRTNRFLSSLACKNPCCDYLNLKLFCYAFCINQGPHNSRVFIALQLPWSVWKQDVHFLGLRGITKKGSTARPRGLSSFFFLQLLTNSFASRFCCHALLPLLAYGWLWPCSKTRITHLIGNVECRSSKHHGEATARLGTAAGDAGRRRTAVLTAGVPPWLFPRLSCSCCSRSQLPLLGVQRLVGNWIQAIHNPKGLPAQMMLRWDNGPQDQPGQQIKDWVVLGLGQGLDGMARSWCWSIKF